MIGRAEMEAASQYVLDQEGDGSEWRTTLGLDDDAVREVALSIANEGLASTSLLGFPVTQVIAAAWVAGLDVGLALAKTGEIA